MASEKDKASKTGNDSDVVEAKNEYKGGGTSDEEYPPNMTAAQYRHLAIKKMLHRYFVSFNNNNSMITYI